ncbi:hypothetical protein R1sor_009112 [Riccia sorocarpa]|uniref:Uncharacterized protein n=1 Tax=Riccia sorocarpa TaxID=122646 RepID=A0ABD3H4V3_9MARC
MLKETLDEKTERQEVPDYDKVLQDMDIKLGDHRSGADIHRRTSNNLRIIGVEEVEGEDAQEVATKLLREALQLQTPAVEHVVPVGK